MSRPATRVLAVLELLQDRGLVPAEELAERLGTDTRTIRRYVTALREMDIPVQAERGRYGGYRLARGYRLPPLMLSDDEAVAVAVALTAAGDSESVTEPTAKALLKLHRVLPVALRERVSALITGTSVVADRTRSAQPEPDVALTVAAAARARRRLRLLHRAYDGPPVQRDVDPYGLVVHRGRWYLAGFDHLRQEIRSFRVDRIEHATELATRFEPPDDFDPIHHVMHGLTFGAWTHRSVVWLDTSLQEARARLPLMAGELEESPSGGVTLTSGVENLAGMAQLLASLPWRFTVLEPAEVVEALEKHHEQLSHSLARSRRL